MSIDSQRPAVSTKSDTCRDGSNVRAQGAKRVQELAYRYDNHSPSSDDSIRQPRRRQRQH